MPTPDQIKDFAVSYEALWDALNTPDHKRNRSTWNSVCCWAGILMRAQRDVGVVLMADVTLQGHIDVARKHMERIDGIMSGRIHEDGISPV